uniref:Inactive dipeptidyl peptidase 10-like n=1 Tax=Leptobrachium leishanense TaxID=445787 RepID=A0A8C5M7Q3_9ANUR
MRETHTQGAALRHSHSLHCQGRGGTLTSQHTGEHLSTMIVTTQQNVGPELDMRSSGAPPRNWRGIGLAIVVIVGVLSLVLLSIFILSPETEKLPEKTGLTLSDLESVEYQVQTPRLYWASDNEIIMESRDGNLIKRNLQTEQSNILLSNITLMSLKASNAELSPDLQHVLLVLNKQQVVGVSFTAMYAVYNIRTRELWDLKPPLINETILQFAAWGPRGSQLVFIVNDDIYYQQSATGPAIRLTTSGNTGTQLNGITDWTYHEEVLQSYAAHWWSPDGSRLAYLSINNTLVPSMELPQFVGADYPTNKRYAYPKAGQVIPQVKVFSVNLNGPSHTIELLPPDTFQHREYYITHVSWITNIRLAVIWLSRSQSHTSLTFCDVTTGACVERYRATSDTWISTQGRPLFSPDAVFLPVPVKQGARGEFVHIAMLSMQLGGKDDSLHMLTSGDWDVTRIVSFNPGNQTVYFLSTEGMARRRHLHSVEKSGSLSCISCDLIPDCNFVDVAFSPGGNYFILYCKGPGIPHVTVHQIQNPKAFTVIEDNEILKDALNSKLMPEVEFKSIQLDKFELPIRLTLPPGFQDSQFPLVLLLPEAPGSQQVTEEFSLEWESVLVSSFQIILAHFDGRGSKYQGLQLLHETDHRLGSAEIKDYLTLVQYLRRLPFVDKKQVGVYGKAYGGFLALKLLAQSEDLFACGVAVAPITNFQIHSAVISERYLGMPSQETSAYTIYPDEDHFFWSKGSLYHLKQSVISYLQSCLQVGYRRQRSQ